MQHFSFTLSFVVVMLLRGHRAATFPLFNHIKEHVERVGYENSFSSKQNTKEHRFLCFSLFLPESLKAMSQALVSREDGV